MADFNSSLPVRTETAGDVIAKLCDATTTSQQLAIDASGLIGAKISDTSGNALNSTSNALNVFITGGGSSGTVVDQAAFTYGTSTEMPVGGVFQDTGTTLSAGQTGAVRLTAERAFHTNLRTAAGAELLGSAVSAASIPVVIASDQGSFTVAATQSGTWTVQPGNTQNTTAWLVQDASDGPVGAGTAAAKSSLAGLVFDSTPPTLTNGQQVAMQGDASGNLKVNLATALPTGTNTIGSVKLTDGTNTASLTGAGEVKVDVTQPLPAGTNLLGSVNVFQAGAATSPSNPIFVTNVDTAGTAVDSYATTAALAAAATTNLDYTVTAAKTFYSQQVWASASGKIKVVVQYETAAGSGTFNTFWVGFNSTANPNVLIPLPPTKTQVTGAKIRVAITNTDNQSQDVYKTLTGTEL